MHRKHFTSLGGENCLRWLLLPHLLQLQSGVGGRGVNGICGKILFGGSSTYSIKGIFLLDWCIQCFLLLFYCFFLVDQPFSLRSGSICNCLKREWSQIPTTKQSLIRSSFISPKLQLYSSLCISVINCSTDSLGS